MNIQKNRRAHDIPANLWDEEEAFSLIWGMLRSKNKYIERLHRYLQHKEMENQMLNQQVDTLQALVRQLSDGSHALSAPGAWRMPAPREEEDIDSEEAEPIGWG